MEEIVPNKPSITAVQLGVLFGVFMILEFVLLYIIDVDPISNPMVGTLMNVGNYLLFPVSLIYIACTTYKKANNGFISFGECLKKGVTVCLIAGLLSALFSVVFTYIFPEYIEDVLRKTRAVMIQKSPELTAEQLDMAMTWTKKFMNPMLMVPVSILMFSFIGLIYSLIIGAIVKKDQPQSI